MKNKIVYIGACVLLALMALMNMTMPLVIKALIDNSVKLLLSNTMQWMLVLSLMTMILLIAEYFSRKLIALFVREKTISMREAIVKGFLGMSVKTFKTESTGDRMATVLSDLPSVIKNYYGESFNLVRDSLAIFFGVGALLSLNIYLLLTVVLINLLPLATPLFFTKRMQKETMLLTKERKKLSSNMNESFEGFEVIKSYHVADKMLSSFSRFNKTESYMAYKLSLSKLASNMIAGVFSFGGYVLLVGVGMYLIIEGKVTAGGFIASLQISELLLSPVLSIADEYLAMTSVKELRKSMDAITHGSNVLEKGKTIKSVDGIELVNVNVMSEDRHLLKGIHLSLKRHKKYAIVGESGSGKTTLMHTIARLRDIDAGSIKVNGMMHTDILEEDYFSRISMVHQHSFVFDDTLEANISLGARIDKDEYDVLVKQFGIDHLVNLKQASGGERKRIGLARALVRDANVILLDEVTSALDPMLAMKLEKMIVKLSKRTIVAITHMNDLSVLREYDEIICMQDGSVVEVGHADELIAQGGYFNRLMNAKEYILKDLT